MNDPGDEGRAVMEVLAGARLRAALARPYLATALFSMTVVLNERAPAMAVDSSWRCHIRPELVKDTPTRELAALWVHQVSHLLRGHAERARNLGDDVTAEIINLAQDLEINDDLEGEGLLLPDDAARPSDYGLGSGEFFEQYVEQLQQLDETTEGLEPCGDCGSGAHGARRAWEPDPDADGEGDSTTGTDPFPAGLSPVEAELVAQQTARQIAELGTAAGSVPGSWVRWARAMGESGADWRGALRAAVRSSIATVTGRVDYSYARLSRRASAVPGVVLAAMVSRRPRLAVVVDTSGSMGERLVDEALGEVEAVLRAGSVREDDVTIFATDVSVHWVGRHRDLHEVELMRGGGTDMGEGITEAIHPPHRCDLVIVLTDGRTPWPAADPGVPVVVGLLTGAIPSSEPGPQMPPSWAATVVVPRST